ncbi:MAG: insulinase family protein [Nitrospirae bacterium]|nr:insulinase family protein [Nitrospirota bacterium]
MFTKSHLSNGIPVVMEQLKGFRSFILAIWVKVGSRSESPEKNGVSHFLEHMFFKGTKKRSATDISFEIDSLGGDINAFTSRENTAFYIKVLDEYIVRGIELLSDIFLHSQFLAEEIDKERGVIKEEIKLVEDTPDDYIHDLFIKSIWGDTGLGQSVLGKKETIKNITREDLISHVRKYYGTSDTIIACTGNFDADMVIKMLNQYMGELRRGSEPEAVSPSTFNSTISVYPKDLSETHICLGVEGLPYTSKERYAIAIVNTILGSSVSSRLFQEIREKRGYAYSVYSFLSSYRDAGYWGVYAGTGKKKAVSVIEMTMKEMTGLKDTMSEEELQRAKEQLKGNLILGLESTSSRMQNIARQEIYYGRYFSNNEIIKSIEAVTLPQIKALADRLINPDKMSMTILGPVKEEEFKGCLGN